MQGGIRLNRRCLITTTTAIIIAALAANAASALAAEDFQIVDHGDGTCTITAYNSPGGFFDPPEPLHIPTTIAGLTVTAIGPDAFSYSRISSVVIPDTVITIGTRAFYDCSPLGDVIIGSNVTTIGDEAFASCYGFTVVIIPDTATAIGNRAFHGCHTLIGVVIGNSVNTIGDEAFTSCSRLTGVYFRGNAPTPGSDVFADTDLVTVYYLTTATGWSATYSQRPTVSCQWSIENNLIALDNGPGTCTINNFLANDSHVTIPTTIAGRTVTAIAPNAFYRHDSLTSVIIPDTVTTIAARAFYLCNRLVGAVIGNGLTAIGDEAFSECNNLTDLYFRGNAPTPGNDVFYGTFNVTIYHLPTATGWTATYGEHPTVPCQWAVEDGFVGIDNGLGTCTLSDYVGPDRHITIPPTIAGRTVTTIADEALHHRYDLTSITIPDTVTLIGLGAFYDSGVNSVIIGNSVSTIGYAAFAECQNLVSITIPDSVTTIGERAFYNCYYLTSVVLGNGITEIPYEAFADCDELTDVVIPDGVTTIGNVAFSNCFRLDNVTIPDSVTTIGYNAFADCYNLTGILVLDGVTSLNSRAFRGCQSLSGVVLGSNLRTISNEVFDDCYRLTGVYFRGNAPTLGADVFPGTDYVTVYHLPDTTGWTATFGQQPTVSCQWSLADEFIIFDNGPDTCTISSYVGPDMHMTIPTTIAGRTVTTIASHAFFHFRFATVIVPDSITTIEDYAFRNCERLTGIYFHGNAPVLGTEAFAETYGVTMYHQPTATGWSTNHGSVPIVSSPWAVVGDFFIVDNDPTTCTITNYSGLENDLTIPPTLAGRTITALGHRAFASHHEMTSVVIPDSVTTIGRFAFYACTNLTDLTIGNNVTTIGDHAFMACLDLPSVIIPDSVTTIGDEAFFFCLDLTSMTIGSSLTSINLKIFDTCLQLTDIIVAPTNATHSSIDGVLFNKNQTELIKYPIGRIGVYATPNSVTTIGAHAFYACHGLTNVTIPDSVATIGEYAFSGCVSLAGITLGNSLTTIDSHAFGHCRNLIDIVIPENVTTIGDQSFSDCDDLTGVYFRGYAPTLGVDVFSLNSNATAYYLPSSTGWDETFGGLPTAVWPTSPADADGNYVVNLADLAPLTAAWGRTDCTDTNGFCDGGDFDQKGSVDLTDLALLAEDWLFDVLSSGP